jgi:hypothetical protein
LLQLWCRACLRALLLLLLARCSNSLQALHDLVQHLAQVGPLKLQHNLAHLCTWTSSDLDLRATNVDLWSRHTQASRRTHVDPSCCCCCWWWWWLACCPCSCPRCCCCCSHTPRCWGSVHGHERTHGHAGRGCLHSEHLPGHVHGTHVDAVHAQGHAVHVHAPWVAHGPCCVHGCCPLLQTLSEAGWL